MNPEDTNEEQRKEHDSLVWKTRRRRETYRRWFLVRILWVFAYAYFVFACKVVKWFDFDFLHYDGPSGFLQFCRFVGHFVAISVVMYPVGCWLVLLYGKGSSKGWEGKDYLSALLYSALVSPPLLVFGWLVVVPLGWLIGLMSEDASEAFLSFTLPFQ